MSMSNMNPSDNPNPTNNPDPTAYPKPSKSRWIVIMINIIWIGLVILSTWYWCRSAIGLVIQDQVWLASIQSVGSVRFLLDGPAVAYIFFVNGSWSAISLMLNALLVAVYAAIWFWLSRFRPKTYKRSDFIGSLLVLVLITLSNVPTSLMDVLRDRFYKKHPYMGRAVLGESGIGGLSYSFPIRVAYEEITSIQWWAQNRKQIDNVESWAGSGFLYLTLKTKHGDVDLIVRKNFHEIDAFLKERARPHNSGALNPEITGAPAA